MVFAVVGGVVGVGVAGICVIITVIRGILNIGFIQGIKDMEECLNFYIPQVNRQVVISVKVDFHIAGGFPVLISVSNFNPVIVGDFTVYRVPVGVVIAIDVQTYVS